MVFGGIISRVKGVFAKEPEVVEEIQLDNIDEWFSSKYSSRQDFLKGQIGGIKERISQESSSSRKNMESLKNAQLRNTNIPEKAKHFMEGNRSIYIQKTEQFLEGIDVPGDVTLISSFISGFDKRLEELGKSTARAVTILREFLEEESAKVAGNIGNIKKLVEEMKEALNESKLKEMDEIKHTISKIKSKISHKAFLAGESSKKQSYLDGLKKQKAALEKNIREMENSKDYKDYQMLKQRLSETRKLVKEKESEITYLFAGLERPMKKYTRVIYGDKGLFEKYIEKPVDALMQDFGLKIISMLENMKKAIVDNTLELKDKQRVKAIEDIRMLDKEFLSKFMSEYAKVKKKEGDIAAGMKGITVIGELAKAKESLNIKSAMLEKAEKDIESLNSELGKIDMVLLKKGLAEEIAETAGIKVSIS